MSKNKKGQRCKRDAIHVFLVKSLENVLEIDVWKKKLPADGDDTSIDVIYVMH